MPKMEVCGVFNRMKSQVREEWHPISSCRVTIQAATSTAAKIASRCCVFSWHLTVASPMSASSSPAALSFRRRSDERVSTCAAVFQSPEQLAEPDGMIRFQFGFVVQISGQFTFRVNKYLVCAHAFRS